MPIARENRRPPRRCQDGAVSDQARHEATQVGQRDAVLFASDAAAAGSPYVEVPVAHGATLLAGFGAPKGQADFIPFLRTATRGRGTPDERLEGVAHHYRHFGGVSPINAQ